MNWGTFFLQGGTPLLLWGRGVGCVCVWGGGVRTHRPPPPAYAPDLKMFFSTSGYGLLRFPLFCLMITPASTWVLFPLHARSLDGLWNMETVQALFSVLLLGPPSNQNVSIGPFPCQHDKRYRYKNIPPRTLYNIGPRKPGIESKVPFKNGAL